MTQLRLEVAGKTDPGCVRSRNEDSLAADPELGLLVVADGMGGHNSGEVASSLATETILEYARRVIQGKDAPVVLEGGADRPLRVRQLEYCLNTANRMIFEKSRSFPKDKGMGTTVVAALADNGSMTVAHVGDSRMYLLRDQRLQALTQDHSLVQDQVRHGLITQEQAEKSNLQNILTRALGTEEKVLVDTSEHPVFPGDILVLCTDGLTKMVSESEMETILQGLKEISEMADALIAAARKAGGLDNITVLVARVLGSGSRGWRAWLPGFLRK